MGETDREFLLRMLSDGEPHSLNEILRQSFADRGCGLTVHSRASDLRRDGYQVANWKDGDRGDGSWYRLLESATVDGLSPVADSSGRPAGSAVSPLGGGAAAAAQLVLPVGTKGAYS